MEIESLCKNLVLSEKKSLRTHLLNSNDDADFTIVTRLGSIIDMMMK